MSGLVTYTSSDDDAEDSRVTSWRDESSANDQSTLDGSGTAVPDDNGANHTPPNANLVKQNGYSHGSSLVPLGAALGPDRDATARIPNDDSQLVGGKGLESRSSALHNITMPEFPNLEIPPSPPGSPAPGMDAKVGQFLSLKTGGIHFNSKLASASALKNPSILPKLMQAAGLEHAVQYATTLPLTAWDRESLPKYASSDELDKAQKDFSEGRVAGSIGQARQFVQASTTSKQTL